MIGPAFLQAGKAIFTVRPPGGAQHYTYRITRKDFEAATGVKGNGSGPRTWYFVGVLAGPDNLSDYCYLGAVDFHEGHEGELKATGRSPAGVEGRDDWRALGAVLPALWRGEMPPVGWEVDHAGVCGRCGRVLTRPESIATGLGPVCAGAGP